VKNETAPVRGGTVPSLELIRGLASLDVFIFHFCILGNISNAVSKIFAWGTEAVIVFFVLSGYVIGLSQQRRHRGPIEFFQARVRRICPIYFLAMGLGLVVAACLHTQIHFWQVVGNIFFLQSFSGSLVQPLGTNFPLWSLGTEFQFYTLFAVLLFFRRNWLWLAWWWIALAALVVRHSGYFGSAAVGLALETLSMSPCWLLGYFASNLRNRRSLSLVQALTLFSMIPMVTRSNFTYTTTNESVYNVAQFLVVALLIVPLIHTLAVRHLYPGEKPMARAWPWIGMVYLGLSLYGLTHDLVHLSVMAGFIAVPVIVAVAGRLWQAGRLRWPIRGPILREVSLFLGGASYALYAIHDPLCRLVIHYTSNHLLQLVLLVPLVGSGTLVLEYVFQPWAAKRLDRIWSRGAKKPKSGLASALSLDR
jgi:peptidoglycan/LPS O-acetylase OafA/YrhL